MIEKKDYQGPLYAPHPDLYEKRRQLGLHKNSDNVPQMKVTIGTYAEQRKERLQSVVDDYLQDHDSTSAMLYEDIKDCLEDIISYHELNKQKAQNILEYMTGKDSTNVDTDSISVNTYEYATDITMQDISNFQRGNSL
jgi:DNA integrity scanning protein DisA with diadenylate cyclase activity